MQDVYQADDARATVQVLESEAELDGSDTSTVSEEKGEQITDPFDTRAIRIESKSGNMNTLLARLENDEISILPRIFNGRHLE